MFLSLACDADQAKYSSLDRKILFCQSKNNQGFLAFVFNSNKVFNVELYKNEGDKFIHDEFYFLKESKELGNSLYNKNGKLYWQKNPWNGFYQFSFDVENKKLEHRYVLKKNKISNYLSNIMGKSQFYLKTMEYSCFILKDWRELEKKLD